MLVTGEGATLVYKIEDRHGKRWIKIYKFNCCKGVNGSKNPLKEFAKKVWLYTNVCFIYHAVNLEVNRNTRPAHN